MHSMRISYMGMLTEGPCIVCMGMSTQQMHGQTDVYYTYILQGIHGGHAHIYYISAYPRIINVGLHMHNMRIFYIGIPPVGMFTFIIHGHAHA